MKTIYLVNEIKDKTEALKTSVGVNVVRDYRHDGKSFIAVSLNQPLDSEAIIVVYNHRYQTNQVEVPGGKFRCFVKTSQTITILTNLYNRGINKITIVNFTKDGKESITITQGDNLYDKINELCHVERTKKEDYKKYVGCIKSTPKKEITFNYSANTFKEYNIPVPTAKDIEKFKKYAKVYDLNPDNKDDLLTFLWISKNTDRSEFIDGTKFICPKCGNIVHVNGHEKFIKGRYINTGETVCEVCYEEFDIHDKQDILNLAKA